MDKRTAIYQKLVKIWKLGLVKSQEILLRSKAELSICFGIACFLLFTAFMSAPSLRAILAESSLQASTVAAASAPDATPKLDRHEISGNEVEDGDRHFFYDFINMLFTLGILVALLFIVSWFLKKMITNRVQQMNVSSIIKILEQRNLSTKSNIYLIEIYGKVFAVGESQNGMIALGEFDRKMLESSPPAND